LQESTPSVAATAADEPASKGDRALERLTQLPAQDQLPGGKWQVGKNYTALVPAQPTSVGPGRVEVVEVFWYGCGHCYQLEPFLESWQKNKAAYIDFVRVPVTWSPQHKGHARLYYTLQALKRDDLHAKVFDAIHRGGRMLVGNDDASTLKEQVAWAKSQGIDEAAFTKEWNGFTVTTSLQRAEQLVRRYRVEGVPFVVVNGKYTTDVGAAGGQSQLVALINDLAAAEKRR
jgi:thiol:disulfide interchange protein DsbA